MPEGKYVKLFIPGELNSVLDNAFIIFTIPILYLRPCGLSKAFGKSD